MTIPEHEQQPNPARSRSRAVAVSLALVVLSTACAVILHQLSAAPGDQPIPLLLAGCAAAFALGTARLAPAVMVGPAALAGFPVEALLDLTLHGGHNLLPIEFAFYAVYMAFGAGAATVGRIVGSALRGAPRGP